MDDKQQQYPPIWMMPNFGKVLATIGIWIGVGIACLASPPNAKEIATAGGTATILMWIFG